VKEARLENGSSKDGRERFEQLPSKQFGFGRVGINPLFDHFFARSGKRAAVRRVGNKNNKT